MNYVEDLNRPLSNAEVDYNLDSLATRLKQAGAEDMSLILRRDLTRPLTSREMDNNFQSLDLAVGDILYGDGPRPSLDLRFSGARFLDPRITFTRASTATYYDATGKLVTAGVNEPRFDYDPATGESRGLLVEGQATNLLLGSDSPATQVVVVTATAMTLSFIGTGTITLSDAYTGTLVGTGDERSTLTFTPSSGSLTLTVSGNVEFAQLEVGSFPTSYIPTEGSQVTRAADQVSRELGEEFNAREFTLFVEFDYLLTDSVQAIAALNSDGSTSNRFVIESSPYFRTRDGKGALPSTSNSALPSGKNKIAYAYTAESVVLAANGVITNQAAGDFSELADRLADQASVFLGENSLGGTRQSGQYSRVTLFPRALTNAQLQALTA